MEKSKSKNQHGWSLIETVVYAAILSSIIVVVISFSISIIQTWSRIKTQRDLIDSATNVLNYIAQTVRPAENIYLPTSLLNANLGQLSMKTIKNPPPNENETFVDFYVDNGTLYQKKEGLNSLALTPGNLSITQFKINTITPSTTPHGIQIILGITSNSLPNMSKIFYSTMVWRGGY